MVKTLFILLFIAFPIGQIGRVELGGGVNLLLNDCLVGLVVLFWAIKKLHTKTSIQKTPFTKAILLFFAAALLSLAANVLRYSPFELFVTTLYLIRWIFYAGLFFVVSDFDQLFQQKIRYGLLAIGSITALLGLLQYLLYPDLRNLFYLGWDEHLYRLFSTFFDPNFAGGVFVLTFILAISLASLRPRGLRPKGRGPARLVWVFAAAISFISLLLTYSRSSFISFVIGVFAFLLFSKRIAATIALLLLFMVGIFLLPKDLGGEGVNLLRSASINARLASAEEALTIFQESPIFGVGFNAYRYARGQLGFTATNTFGDIHSASGTDNSFLFVLVTSGLIGFIAYLYLWSRIITYYRQNPLIVASILAIFIHALFVNSLFYPWIMEWLWLLLGVTRVQK